MLIFEDFSTLSPQGIIVKKLTNLSELFSKNQEYCDNFNFYFCVRSNDSLNNHLKLMYKSYIDEIINQLENFGIKFRYYIFDDKNDPMNKNINHYLSSIVLVDKRGIFISCLDNSNEHSLLTELQKKINEMLDPSKINIIETDDKIEKLKYKELKNIIENYNDRNDDSIDVLNFLFENVSKIEVIFKKSFFIQNYEEKNIILYHRPEIIRSFNSDNQIYLNTFNKYLIDYKIMNEFTFLEKEINYLSSSLILKNYYNFLNSFGLYFPLNQFRIKVVENLYKTGETRLFSYINLKNLIDPITIHQIIKINEITTEFKSNLNFNFTLKLKVIRNLLSLLNNEDLVKLNDYRLLVVTILDYNDVSALDMLLKSFKIYNKWNEEVKVLFFFETNIFSDMKIKIQNSGFLINCSLYRLSKKINFYNLLLLEKNNIFFLDIERKVLFKGNSSAADVENLYLKIIQNTFKDEKLIHKHNEFQILNKLFIFISKFAHESVLKTIDYNFVFSFVKKNIFNCLKNFSHILENVCLKMYFKARRNEINKMQKLFNEFKELEKITNINDYISIDFDLIETLTLTIGFKCDICLHAFKENENQYFCYWCNYYFCVDCGETINEGKSGIEKLFHSHNLIYINVGSKQFLKDIDLYKLGHNVVQRHFPDTNNQSHIAHCDCCYNFILNCPRFICLNCRPGALAFGGYRDYCEQCFRILTNPSHNMHNQYKNKCLKKDNHDVNHNYLRVHYSSGNYQAF